MFKLLLIVVVVTYLVYKVGSFFFRAGAASQQLRDIQEKQRQAQDASRTAASRAKHTKNMGGDYIDYEEVKK